MPDQSSSGAAGRLTRRRLLSLVPVALAAGACVAPSTRDVPVTGAAATDTPAPTSPTSTSSPSTDPSPSTRPTPRTESSSKAPVAREPAVPTRVRIPSLDLDEELIALGLAANGTLEVPEDADRVGWFDGGGRPGGGGPTVLAGHVDSRTGPAVFYRLTDLVAGDQVVLTSDDGSFAYTVTKTEDVPKDQFPTEAVFGSTPGDELRLITCTGTYDRARRSHRDNRVVHAVAVR